MCRLEPSLPLSVGLGPVSWPPGGLVPKSHQCWPGSNQFGQDGIEGVLITDGALAASTFARWDEGWNEWFEWFPQLFTGRSTRHTAAKHKRFAALQRKVALAALSALCDFLQRSLSAN